MPSKNVVIIGVATWADELTSDAHPEHPIVIPPPQNIPTHPIVIPPLPPLVSDGVPVHPIILPGEPTHPIAPGGPPPQVSHPIILPGEPAHPIYLPDDTPPVYDFSWAWSPYYGWIILPGPGEARPKQ